ncbi:unnamed protein product, partial [Leptidea sinapis]
MKSVSETKLEYVIEKDSNCESKYHPEEAPYGDIIQNNRLQFSNLKDLQPGWKFLSRYRDVSDIEWSSWKYFIETTWCYFIIQYILSEIIREKFPEYLKYWYIVSSCTFVCKYTGYKHLVTILMQPTIYAAVIKFGGKKISIWIISIILLVTYNSLKYNFYFWSFLEHDDMQDEEVYLLLFCVAWTELRCISYSIDFVENKDEMYLKSKDIINMISYILYLPMLYTGPVILYEDFEKSFTRVYKFDAKIRRFFYDIFIFFTYTLILDYIFHYIYFYAMQSDMELVRQLPSLALCGGGLWMGLQFHMKYVISYGIVSSFTRLDNIEPPPAPRCIARIHVYSQMWRHFDVGLYRFLVNGSFKLPIIVYKLLASLGTFIFIFLWHGMVWHIFMWTVLNYIGITLEYSGKLISRHTSYQWLKQNILKTEANETRFIAVLCTPLLALSAISNFYLFAGTDVGNLFFERFFQPSLGKSLLLCFSLYCCCQVSIALEDVPSRGNNLTKTDLKKS